MPTPDDTSTLPVALGRLAVHQDFLWFGVIVAWSLVFVVWARHPHKDWLWRLLPWIAAGRVAGGLVQFLAFNPPFDLFLERLVPGTHDTYLPALLDPNLTADLLLAVISCGLLAGWSWQKCSDLGWRRWRWLAVLVPLAVVPLHLSRPQWSCWLIGLLPLLPAWQLTRQRAVAGELWLALLPGALVPALSTIGPLAYHLGMLQRSATATPMGLLAAAYQFLTAGLLLLYLRRLRPAASGSPAPTARLARPYLAAAAAMLAGGLWFAWQTGRDNREEVLNGRLRTTHYHAGLLAPADFAPLANPELRLEPHPLPGRARLPESLVAVQRRAVAVLGERVRATQFQEEARFLILHHDGWLVAVAAWPWPDAPGLVRRIQPAGQEDRAAWAEARLHRVHSPVPEQGTTYRCRAPVTDAAGRMLGWLEYPRREFYSSMERKWRAGPLLVTALALVVTAGLYHQKRAHFEREAALRAAAVEAEANRLKTAFLAKVSHELRTPIQSLLGYSELLRGRLGDDPQARTWLGALQEHGEIMTRLINDLLDLSAAESGSFRLIPAPVAPAALVRRVVDGLGPRAAAKGLRLVCETSAAVPAWVEADGGRLGQVVLNLAGNALKFTDRGEVCVRLDAVPAGDGRVRLSLRVTDTGPGIPPALQSRLFAPFSRLESTAAKEGTGLGLALSAALCRAMGGSLRVESDGLNGSCFIAECLATSCAAPRENTPPVPAAATGPTPVVLVIEDNTLLRELFISYLAGLGCVCTAAGTGAAALARIKAVAPGVILLDLSLPDTDGIALMPALRAAAPAARVLGVSAHAGATERERALAAGMAAFFAKPVPLATLGAAVLTGTAAASGNPEAYAVPPHLRAVFREELPGLRAELAGAVAAGDLARLARRAHYLRNSALVVEARELLEACTDLELAAQQQARAAVAAAWRRCETAIGGLLQDPA